MSNHSRLIAVAVLTLCLGAQAAADAARPRVGLVLGGGGARGAAHIGVLELLEELRVPVDCVAGTSMGGLVAGAYASGLTPAQMRKALADADWREMFIDNPPYEDINLHRKKNLRRYISGTETGVKDGGVQYQPGVVDGQKIKLFFNQLVGDYRGERRIEDLSLPLTVVATDIGSGEKVAFRKGSLTDAMRSSMSVPGLLSPAEVDGRKLVDGGLVDNVPIDEARSRCQADIVIAVNVGSPLLKASDIGSLLSVSAQMVNILTEQNVTRSLASLKPDDIYIKPDLGTITAGDFQRNAEAADRGRAAAETVRDRLARLGTSPARYAEWRRGVEGPPRQLARVDAVEVVGLQRVNPEAVERRLDIEPGELIEPKRIDQEVMRVYGDGFYQSVDYEVLTVRDRNILRIMPVEKSWGPDYLRGALTLEADSYGNSLFSLRAAYQKTLLNRFGGEMIAAVQLGSNYGAEFQFYQPLDPQQRFFLQAEASYFSRNVYPYQNEKSLAKYAANNTELSVAAGINLGVVGQARVGWVGDQWKFKREIGSPELPEGSASYSGWEAALEIDQYNSLFFPSDGYALLLRYFDSPDAGFSRLDASVGGAYSIRNTVVNGRLRYTGSLRGTLPPYNAATLGGFRNLSAFTRGQILGDDMAYASLGFEQIIGTFPIGIQGDIRLGLLLEAATVGNFYTETNLAKYEYLGSAAIYLGGNTPIGPAYVGFGYSPQGSKNLFLSIGLP